MYFRHSQTMILFTVNNSTTQKDSKGNRFWISLSDLLSFCTWLAYLFPPTLYFYFFIFCTRISMDVFCRTHVYGCVYCVHLRKTAYSSEMHYYVLIFAKRGTCARLQLVLWQCCVNIALIGLLWYVCFQNGRIW